MRIEPKNPKSCVRREVVPEQAEVIRRIFQMTVDGLGPLTIASMLNAERVPAPKARFTKTPRAPRWEAPTIRLMVRKELYAGRIGIPPREDPSIRIIDEALWLATQRALDARRENAMGGKTAAERGPDVHRGSHLLSGLAICGGCGSRLIAWRRKLKPRVGSDGTVYRRENVAYRCLSIHKAGVSTCRKGVNALPAKAAERAVWLAVRDQISAELRTSVLDEAVDAICSMVIDQPADTTAADLEKAETVVARLIAAIADPDAGDVTSLIKARKEAQKKVTELRAAKPAGTRSPAEQAEYAKGFRDMIRYYVGAALESGDEPPDAGVGREVLNRYLVGP